MKDEKQDVLGIRAPQQACDDNKCPFHSGLLVKRELLVGEVLKKDSNRSATVVWSRPFYLPKYERYEQRRSRLRVHNPACINAQVGDHVVVARTRPLSKTKHHVILGVQRSTHRQSENDEQKKEKGGVKL